MTSSPKRSPKKYEKRVHGSSSLRRSNRLKGGTQVSYCESLPRRSDRVKGENGNSSSSLGGVSRKIKRKLVANESKESAIVPPVKEDDLKKQFSPHCSSKGSGRACDPVFGICCYFCRQKKLCGEEDCRRCGGLDMDQPRKGKTNNSVCQSSNEMEEVREKKIKWICRHCMAGKGISRYGIYNRSLDGLLCLKKRMMDLTRVTTFRASLLHVDNGDVDLSVLDPQTTPKEGLTHGKEGPTHELKTEEASLDHGQPIGIATESDMGGGHDAIDFFGAAGYLTPLASPLPRTSNPLAGTAAVGQPTEQPKQGHDEMRSRLKALEQSVVQGVEEMKQLVYSSCATLKQEMRFLFIKTLEDFQGRSIDHLIQNYGLIDMHVGRLEQHITTHGSDLKREVSQMKMSLTEKNIGSSK